MPLFMDVHKLDGPVSADDVAKAHAADLEKQGEYGVEYKRYWVDENGGRIFCLVDAPDADTAARVHREAHGLVADEIFEVSEHS
ncbi:MAG TPA: DUF4242 domain-containing protein [Acidimicrobiia bacterium]|nr:DUF4242 domain-containing protein [Acidimicrobiia bacterium]